MKIVPRYLSILASFALLTSCATSFQNAAYSGKVHTVQAALDKGANVNEWFDEGFFGNSALGVASRQGNTDVVKLLIDRGADVNMSSKGGDSPLGNAASNGYPDIARILIEKGADIEMAITGLEKRVAFYERWLVRSGDGVFITRITEVKGGIKLLEKLQREYFPQVQQIQIVPGSATTVPGVGEDKAAKEHSDATQKLLEAKKLLDANIISREEYEDIKTRLLPSVLQK